MANRADPDQLASSDPTLFAKAGYIGMSEMIKLKHSGNSIVDIRKRIYFRWLLWIWKQKIIWGISYPYTSRDVTFYKLCVTVFEEG